MGENCLKNIKFIALTTILIFILIVIPAGFAMDNETAVSISDDDALSSVDEDILANDYYFDASIENDDGNGSVYNPYKELTTDRIKSNSVIHLASGKYYLSNQLTVNNVTIIGESVADTIVDNVIFTVSNSLTLHNVTFEGSSITSNANLNAFNSIFKDSYSTMYGGVINSDKGHITLKNCTFTDNVAVCGAAIYIKSGSLDIEDSVFLNNYASLFGGAIMSVGTNLNLNNVSARNNKAEADGGFVYSFNGGSVFITNSSFINNSADNGGALFIDNSDYNVVKNNSFYNNTLKSLYLFYNLNSTVEGNSYSSEDDFYETMEVDMFIGDNNYTLYNYQSDNITDLPSKYDLRELGYVTSVKNQGSNGNCWAFATMATLESCILKALGNNLDLSESNLKNLFGSYSDYGWNYATNNGGIARMGYNYLISWLGPVLESDDNYIIGTLFSKVINSIMHVQNVLFLQRNNFTDNDEIKKAIMTYGAVQTPVYASFDSKGKQYYSGPNNANHAVVIVGWDDDMEFTNAPGKGGWIIKNSWGSGWRNNGYGYVSYYDVTCAPVGKVDSVFTFILNDTMKFDKNYQYDIQGKSDFFLNSYSTVWYKNIFNATDDEYLAAVSTIFEKDSEYTFSVYVNNQLKLTQSGFSKPGYYTFNLNEIIPLKAGDSFEVVFNITVDGDAGVPISENVSFTRYYYKENTSFISYDGENWTDLYSLYWKYTSHVYYSQVACIKAFTILDSIKTDIVLSIENITDDSLDLIATVYNQWGYPVSNGNVVFKVGDSTYTVSIHNGVAKLSNVYFSDGINNFTASFNQIGYYNSSDYALFSKDLIISIIALDNSSYHNIVNISTVIKDINGNLIDYGKIIFNIEGKNYTSDISNGYASINHTFTNFGLNNVTVYYEGYHCFNPSNVSALINVSLISTQLSLIVLNDYNPINITADVVDEYGNKFTGGFVTFVIERESYVIAVCDGRASLSHIFTKTGLNNVFATYSDTDNIYNSSNNLTSVNISLINTYLELSVQKSTNPVEVIARVYDQFNNPVLTGEVTFTFEGSGKTVSINNGIALCSHIFTNVGYNSISATYRDATFKFNLSDNQTSADVLKTKINMSLQIINNLEFTVELSQPVNEYVYLFLDNTKYMQKTNGGKCTFTFDSIKSRNHAVQVALDSKIYECSDIYDEFYVYYDTNLTVKTYYIYYDGIYSVSLRDITNNLPVKGKKVTFIINNQVFENTTDENGTAAIHLDLIGKYDINVTFDGDEDFTKSFVSSTVEIASSIISADATKTLNSQYEIRFLDRNGNPLKNTLISILIASREYKLLSDENGVALLNIDLNPGKYNVRITNPSTGEIKTQNLEVVSRISENKDLTMYYGAGKYYTVRVVDDNGNAEANVKVTFTINGKNYVISTDNKGYASVKISQNPGKYTITAQYKGFKVSNKITVKSTIITKNIKVKKGKTIKFTAKLVNNNGKILKNKKITFKFKGKTYKVKTNNNGKATLKITKKYKVGKYTITSKYGKLTIKNTVQIKK